MIGALEARCERVLGRLGNGAALALLLGCHVAVLLAFAWLTRGIGPLHHDMTEAFAWGQEFQAGYHKHPPLFAWQAALWFKVFPRADWAFYLLSAVNSAVGLAGVFALAGRLLDDATRWVALALVWLTPFFTLHAITFNANSALLACWPWTAYFVVRSLETGSARDGALAGGAAALAMLAKYFSVLLLVACLIAIVLHPRARAYFRSSAPYAALAAGLAGLAWHGQWLLAGDGATLLYALQKTAFPPGDVRMRALGTLGGAVASFALAALVFALAFRGRASSIMSNAARGARQRPTIWIAILAFGPLALAFALVPVANVRVTSPFLIPVFFMATIAPLALGHAAADARAVRIVGRACMAVAGLMLAGGVVARLTPALQECPSLDEVRREAARFGSDLWHARVGSRLAYVGGDDVYAKAAAFYGPDAPSLVALEAPDTTPWARREDWRRAGLLLICAGDCRASLPPEDRARATTATESFDRGPRCRAAAPQRTPVTFVIVPPGER